MKAAVIHGVGTRSLVLWEWAAEVQRVLQEQSGIASLYRSHTSLRSARELL